MPLFEYTDARGNKTTVSGEHAVDDGGDVICREVLGDTLAHITRAFFSLTFMYNGKECAFMPTLRIVQLDAASTKADLMTLTSGMKDLAENYGFIDCPECKGVHDRKVINCRRCGCRAEIPDEARQDFAASMETPEEPSPEQEAQDGLAAMEEAAIPKDESAIARIGEFDPEEEEPIKDEARAETTGAGP